MTDLSTHSAADVNEISNCFLDSDGGGGGGHQQKWQSLWRGLPTDVPKRRVGARDGSLPTVRQSHPNCCHPARRVARLSSDDWTLCCVGRSRSILAISSFCCFAIEPEVMDRPLPSWRFCWPYPPIDLGDGGSLAEPADFGTKTLRDCRCKSRESRDYRSRADWTICLWTTWAMTSSTFDQSTCSCSRTSRRIWICSQLLPPNGHETKTRSFLFTVYKIFFNNIFSFFLK